MNANRLVITKVLSPTFMGHGAFLITPVQNNVAVTLKSSTWQLTRVVNGAIEIVNDRTYDKSVLHAEKFIVTYPSDSLIKDLTQEYEFRYLSVKAVAASVDTGKEFTEVTTLAYIQVNDLVAAHEYPTEEDAKTMAEYLDETVDLDAVVNLDQEYPWG